MIKGYKDLIVWQKSMELVELIYKYITNFPKNEDHCYSAQIKRCTISIPSNIAEGYGRKSAADYKRFLKIARGSLYELQTQTEISKRLCYITEQNMVVFESISFEIEKMLNSLINKL